MAAYTTTLLLNSVQRQSFSPANQSTFGTSDILELGDEVIKTTILPAILNVREEYYVFYKDHTIVAGQSAYVIPSRAIGLSVREIQLIDSNGNVNNLPRTSLDRLHFFSPSGSGPDVFYLRGDNIVLLPTPTAAMGTLRVWYSLRPGKLVEVTEAAVVSAIDTTTNIITVTTIPSTWATGNSFDLISASGSHRHLSIDLTSTLVSGTAITLPSLPSDLAVGDYVALSGESPLVQMPPDFQPILATLIAAEMLLAMNQPSGEKVYAKGLKNLEVAQDLLTPRVVGEEELIVPDWS